MRSGLTDAELVTALAGGQADALDELMRRHEDLVFAVCLRIMGSRDLALDAVQETFLTLFRKADRYREEAAFTTWLYRVATNTCYDLHRKRKRRAADPLPEHHDPVDATAGDAFTSIELRPSVVDALQRLPEDFRSAVVLADIEGLAVAEIAEVLQIPPGTVKSRVFRGRRLLADLLGNLAQT
jgi:RNA polymerase sigma-70 factor, ECF subfamily